MSEPMKYPGLGTGVWIQKDGKVLMGMRQGKHGKGTWGAAGGKLEMYEDWVDNCIRETQEECGLQIANIRFMTVTNDRSPEWGTHYVTLHFAADWVSGEPRDEEGGMSNWGWYAWNALPQPLFYPAQNLFDSGVNPLEFKPITQ